MKDKVVIVTGANSGIGMATASGLAKMGSTVVMVCRNKEKGEAALSEIKTVSSNEKVELMIADLSSRKAIRNLSEEFRNKHQSLHVLINNAGVYFTKRHMTEDGLEMTFAVNYLARFLLTNLLLDILKKSAPSRIINVTGTYHKKGRIDFEDLQKEKNYNGMDANNQAKLADILFTHELARRLKGTGVTVNCLHPGAVATRLVEKDKDYPAFLRFMYKLFKPLLRSPEKGAETTLYLASSPRVQDITGKYFVNKKITRSSPESYDPELAIQLWEVSNVISQL